MRRVRERARYAANRDTHLAARSTRRRDNAAAVAASKAAREAAAPEKVRAQRAVRTAIKQGRLVPEPCLFCDAERVEAHHHDYSEPLSVTWLCRRHHRLVHRIIPAGHTPAWATDQEDPPA